MLLVAAPLTRCCAGEAGLAPVACLGVAPFPFSFDAALLGADDILYVKEA